ncbi:hypothetical protein EDB85DRAFT_1893336 [Lactarius pseudohatsudake]|nr:hypothetical protein EDB85DRAFT_1893336 [Lactarius pseudohatsudake]
MTNEKHFYQLSVELVDELVDEWTPEPLGAPLTQEEQRDLASAPVVSGANGPWPKLANTGKQVLNLASDDFTGLAGNETSKLWPSRFYGTICASASSEQMLQSPACRDSRKILRGLCVFNFAKRGNTIVADRGIFDHNDFKSLEDLFPSVEKERRDVSDLLQDDSLSSRASLKGTHHGRYTKTDRTKAKTQIRNGRRIGPQWVQLIDRFLHGASGSPWVASGSTTPLRFLCNDPDGPGGINVLPNTPSFSRGVMYHRAGYCRQGARAGRIDHARGPAARAGTRRGASEHPACYHNGAVAQGVQARGKFGVAKVLAKRK